MADEKPKMVTVEALKYHTTAGEAYDVGDTYDVPEHAVENLITQGMAVRVDRVAAAKSAAKAAEKAQAAAAKSARPAKGTDRRARKGRK